MQSGAIALIKVSNKNGSQLFRNVQATWRQESISSDVGRRTGNKSRTPPYRMGMILPSGRVTVWAPESSG